MDNISVIIPVKAELKALELSLKHLQASTYPKDKMEVIVVNDGGDKAIDQVLKNDYDWVKVVSYMGVKGPAYARNRGVEKAKHDWLLFIDTDMLFSPSVIEEIALKYFSDYEYIATDIKIQILDRQSELEKRFSRGSFNFRRRFEENDFGGTGFLLVRKKVFDEIGGFDERFLSGEDNIFGKQVKKLSFKRVFFETNGVFHKYKNTKAFKNAFFKYRLSYFNKVLYYPELFKKTPHPNKEVVKNLKNFIYYCIYFYKKFGSKGKSFYSELIFFIWNLQLFFKLAFYKKSRH